MIIESLLLLVVGFVFLVKGADWFVEAAASIARKFGISELVIGLTIVAMGTSLPEAAVSINAGLHGNAGISVGNVAGSNIMNILVILGITSVIMAIEVQKSTVRNEIPFLIAVSCMFAIFAYTGSQITRLESVGLWIAFLVYLGYLSRMAKKDNLKEPEVEESDDEADGWPIWKSIAVLIISAVLVVKGSDFIVDGASNIASIFGMSDRLIGLTIVAFGTSLPELVTCIAAALKGKADLAIGNIVGSNIFNILFIMGTTSLITNIPVESSFVLDIVIGMGAAIVLWLGVLRKHELRRLTGLLMVALYIAYFFFVLL